MSITPDSPNKMTTRSQVRSNNTSLNSSTESESMTKRDRQRKSQTNTRTPGLSPLRSSPLLHLLFF